MKDDLNSRKIKLATKINESPSKLEEKKEVYKK